MGEGRWIPAYLKVLNPQHDLHPQSTGEPACSMGAWFDMCGMAQWKDGGGLKRGQLRASQSYLATRWNWSRQRAQRFLADLEQRGRIQREQQAGRKPDIINICNYESYADVRSQREQQAGGERDVEHGRLDLPAITPVPEDLNQDQNLGAVAPSKPAKSPVQRLMQLAIEVHREHGVEVPDRDRGKWAGTAKRIVANNELQDVALAVAGIERGGGKLWRWNLENPDREPWNPMDLEQWWTKAVAAGRRVKDGPMPTPEDDHEEREVERMRAKYGD